MPLFTHTTASTRCFRVCNEACADGFREDRRHGLIYGPYRRPQGGFYIDAEEASVKDIFCAYCRADLLGDPDAHRQT